MIAPTAKTRILIISDTHCASLTPRDDNTGYAVAPFPPFKAPLPEADVLIHCGDLTHEGALPQYHDALDMLAEIKAPVKLVIAGNHDLTLDGEYVRKHAKQDGLTVEEADAQTRKMRDVWLADDGRAKTKGVTYLDEGFHSIELPNGAVLNVYASPYTPEFYDWGFPYEKDEDRFNDASQSLEDAKNITQTPIPSSHAQKPVDILITHGPPYFRRDECASGDFAGCPHLLRALMRSRPLVHCFGHIHEGWGAERIQWSADADATAVKKVSIQVWREGGWWPGIQDGKNGVQDLRVDTQKTKEKHAVFVDMTEHGGRGLRRGEETLLVNAAIMDVEYRPVNAPWIIDIDLPRAP